MHVDESHKMAFHTHHRRIEFVVMAFCMTVAPTTSVLIDCDASGSGFSAILHQAWARSPYLVALWHHNTPHQICYLGMELIGFVKPMWH
jgi:hypothetical protein